MVSRVITYGDFIAEMEKTECAYAQLFLERWREAIAANWEEYKLIPLDHILVMILALRGSLWFQELIAATNDLDETHAQKVEAGHAFLRVIHDKAKEFNVQGIKLEEIDTPLSYSEMLKARSGKVVPDKSEHFP